MQWCSDKQHITHVTIKYHQRFFLKVFDAFVIIVSWVLDVYFWEGIWGRPDQEGATLLIIILPWRVVRIVNSKYTY